MHNIPWCIIFHAMDSHVPVNIPYFWTLWVHLCDFFFVAYKNDLLLSAEGTSSEVFDLFCFISPSALRSYYLTAL